MLPKLSIANKVALDFLQLRELKNIFIELQSALSVLDDEEVLSRKI
jgi:hypothetical protein